MAEPHALDDLGATVKNESPEDWEQASVELLKKWRTEALRRVEKIEEDIEEARRMEEMYAQAAEELENRSHEVEAGARELEAKGDAPGAAAKKAEADQLRELARDNYRKADEKGRFVLEHERALQQLRAKSLRLTALIRKRVADVDLF